MSVLTYRCNNGDRVEKGPFEAPLKTRRVVVVIAVPALVLHCLDHRLCILVEDLLREICPVFWMQYVEFRCLVPQPLDVVISCSADIRFRFFLHPVR